jgi:putative aminopeptidase FrvX
VTLLATVCELTALAGPSGHEHEVALAFAKHLEGAAKLLAAFLGGLGGREVVELGSPTRL